MKHGTYKSTKLSKPLFMCVLVIFSEILASLAAMLFKGVVAFVHNLLFLVISVLFIIQLFIRNPVYGELESFLFQC